eukprot:scaffold22080_cov125-Isochrysis_galbana.AAC.8
MRKKPLRTKLTTVPCLLSDFLAVRNSRRSEEQEHATPDYSLPSATDAYCRLVHGARARCDGAHT